ncbi:MAG TPA: hypothetical protein VFU89_06295 [Rhabdochlamydiaceae bacterium]|nr:hypothetical protein [Rhabdochlamydiaceae bacterium]
MSSNLSTIQPQIDALVKLITSLPAVSIDPTSTISQFFQQLLSTEKFFAAAVVADKKLQAVIMSVSAYEQTCSLINSLPKMFSLVEIGKAMAAVGAQQLNRNVVWMGVGTVLTIVGVYKAAEVLTHQIYEQSPDKKDNGYRWKIVAIVGIGAIVFSMFMTHKVAIGLREIA